VGVPDITGGQGLEDVGEALSGIGERLAAADARIKARDAGNDILRLQREHRIDGSKLVESELDAGPITAPGRLEGIGETLEAFRQSKIQQHLERFGPDSALKLEEKLQARHFSFMDLVVDTSLKARKLDRDSELDENLNDALGNVRRNPGSFADEYRNLVNDIDDIPEDDAFKRVRKSSDLGKLGAVVVETLINGNDLEGAEEFLDTVDRNLNDEDQRRLANMLREARKPEKPRLVGDPTSPTGSRFVPESEAVGQPGPPRLKEVIKEQTSKFSEKLQEADAEQAGEITAAALQATQDKTEITLMDTALGSKRFRTGSFSETRVFLGRLGKFLGVDLEDVEQAIGDPRAADIFDAASKRLAVQIAEKLGRITNLSLRFIRDSLPGLMRSEEGNAILIKVMRRIADREELIGEELDKFLQKQLPGQETLRPKNGKSFTQIIRDIEEEDPVINDDLKEQIISGGKDAPSFAELNDQVETGEDIPDVPGFTFVGRNEDGKVILRRDSDGKEFIEK